MIDFTALFSRSPIAGTPLRITRYELLLEVLEDRTAPSANAVLLDGGAVMFDKSILSIALDDFIVSDVASLTGGNGMDVELLLNTSRDLIEVDLIEVDPRFSGVTGDGYGSQGPIGVAVIDTGSDGSHPYLNVAGGVNTVTSGSPQNDIDGHGTHVAGIIASTHPTYRGVAPGVNIYAVKELHGTSGSWFTVADGLD